MDPPKLEEFRMTAKLGEGTFSEVMKVKHKSNGKVYAMKRFRKRFQSSEEVQNLREIQALRRLNPHEHVIDLIDIVFDAKSGILGLTFELMECNLYELISKNSSNMTEHKAKGYFYQICLGMEYMHSKGIFHRDIKPENILIRGGNIKLADFGSCRGIHSKHPYTEYIATRWYRSPECLLCDGTYNYKMDVWGAGCVLFEIITRQPLFPGNNELDQLHKIHDIMGAPSPQLVKKLQGTRKLSQDYNFPPKPGSGLRGLLSQSSQECLSFHSALLAYDPDERISSKDALKHPFFKDIIKQLDEQNEKKALLSSSKELSIEDEESKGTMTKSSSKSSLKVSSIPPLPKVNHQEEVSIRKVESEAQSKIEATVVKGTEPKPSGVLPALLDSKAIKSLPPPIVTRSTAVPAAESKVSKSIIDTHDKTIESVSNTGIRKPPAVNAGASIPSVPQKHPVKDRPSYEAPPLATNSSNYHQTTVREDVSHNESTTANKNMLPKSPLTTNSLKYKRHFDDKKSLDVALARARRAVKRQSDLTNGRKGRFHHNGPNGGQTSESSLSKLVNSTGIATGGIQLGLNVIGKTSGVPKLPKLAQDYHTATKIFPQKEGILLPSIHKSNTHQRS